MSYDNKKDRKRRLEYQKEYYRNHKESLNERNRQYYQQNRELILMQQRKYHENHKVYRNEKNREWKRKLRERLANEIGSKCCICGNIPKIPIYHETNLKAHSQSNPKHILENKEDFISMCRNCHRTLHCFIKHRKEFEKLLSSVTH
jgi:predicted HNH restriction endonuclease